MLLGWNDKHKKKVNRCFIECIKIDGAFECHDAAQHCRAVTDAAVGDGYPAAKTGAAKLFAGVQLVENRSVIQVALIIGDGLRDCFKQSFLAAAFNPTHRSRGRENLVYRRHCEMEPGANTSGLCVFACV